MDCRSDLITFKNWVHTFAHQNFENKNLQPTDDPNEPFEAVDYQIKEINSLVNSKESRWSLIKSGNDNEYLPLLNLDSNSRYIRAMKRCIRHIKAIGKQTGLIDDIFAADIYTLSKVFKNKANQLSDLDPKISKAIKKISNLTKKIFLQETDESINKLEELAQDLTSPASIEKALNFYYKVINSFSEESKTNLKKHNHLNRLKEAGLLILKADLNEWSSKGNVLLAVQRIVAAFNKKDTSLCLNGLRLTTLPEGLGMLKTLTTLELNHNNLSLLPAEIRQLKELKKLYLTYNELSSLPPEICYLKKLETFDISHNDLTLLPPEIGHLPQLKNLNLNDNPFLKHLPLALLNLPCLICLDIRNTGIREESEFSKHVRKWIALCNSDKDLTEITNLTDSEKDDLNIWLDRLEQTRDFQESQKTKLAKIICDMLETVIKNEQFKYSFLAQIRRNNSGCEDRAAMALNELYTSWNLTSISERSLQEKLAILKGVSRTNAIRKAIALYISAYQKTTNVITNESVEIYLFYETELRQQLGLISAIENMYYGIIGKRHWIKKKDLIKAVEETHLDHLVSFDAFKQLVESDQEFMQKVAKKKNILEEEQEELEDKLVQATNEEEKLIIAARMGEIMKEREAIEIQEYKQWFLNHI